MRDGRHPRHAYGPDGKMFEPPMVAHQLKAGFKTATTVRGSGLRPPWRPSAGRSAT